MLNKLKKSNQGFTIIEVMIVLAIAGLILLIVFLAVPALQRNARNTQRKNDVASILSSMSQYTSDNNGSTPTTITVANGQLSLNAGAGTQTEALGKIGFYTAVGGPTALAAGATAGPAANDGTVTAYSNAVCGTNAGGAPIATQANAASRDLVVLYALEQAGGILAECQSS